MRELENLILEADGEIKMNINVGSLIIIGGSSEDRIVQWTEKFPNGLATSFRVVEVLGDSNFKISGYDDLVNIKNIIAYKNIKVGSEIRLKKDIEFEYGIVANKGDSDKISKIDREGFWLERLDIYIEHGFEGEFLELIK